MTNAETGMSAPKHTPGPVAQVTPALRLQWLIDADAAHGLQRQKLCPQSTVEELVAALTLAVEKMESLGLSGSVECRRFRAAIAKAQGGAA